MRAGVYTKYGPPEVVEVREIPQPIAKENEVLIKVHATTVNRTDCGFRSANYFIVRFFSGLFNPNNKVLGNEFAGCIEKIGNNVKEFQIGDKVFGYNDASFGGHAEYMVLAEDKAITTMPENMTYAQAAPITEGAHYALSHIRAAKIKEGQKVLVNGTTGAIGSAMVQILKSMGVEVTAVCDTINIELVTTLGADFIIDYKKEDFTKTNKIYDVVLDAVGKSSFGKCKHLLKKDGIYISTELGYMSQNVFLALITPLIGGKKVLFPIPTSNKKDIVFLKELVVNGKLKPVIDRTYSLDQIVEAYRYVETGEKIGNVVIQIIE